MTRKWTPSFAPPRLISQSCHSNAFDSFVRLHGPPEVQEAASVALHLLRVQEVRDNIAARFNVSSTRRQVPVVPVQVSNLGRLNA
jgi:hypothetical protein